MEHLLYITGHGWMCQMQGFHSLGYRKIPGLFQDTRSIFQDPRDKQPLLQYPGVGLLYGIEACKCAYFGVRISIVAKASASLPSKFQDFPWPNSFSRTFQVLEILQTQFQDFPGGVRTLQTGHFLRWVTWADACWLSTRTHHFWMNPVRRNEVYNKCQQWCW